MEIYFKKEPRTVPEVQSWLDAFFTPTPSHLSDLQTRHTAVSTKYQIRTYHMFNVCKYFVIWRRSKMDSWKHFSVGIVTSKKCSALFLCSLFVVLKSFYSFTFFSTVSPVCDWPYICSRSISGAQIQLL